MLRAMRPMYSGSDMLGTVSYTHLIGEYNRLSDAPAVAQELASMRQTRLARTVLTGVLTLFLLYLGLSARTGWLPPIGVLDRCV